MTNERMKELYDNMLNHISELVSGSDLIDTLHCIGFTDEEITDEFSRCNYDEREGNDANESVKKPYDFEEYCPYCDDINEVVWDGISHTTVCEKCHQPILLCSICEAENRGNCPYEKELAE